MENNQPEKKFRAGAISATVWKNVGQSKAGAVEYRTISLQRGYKDKEGKWQTTTSMRLNDLPRASVVLNKAYEYLVLSDKSITSTSEMPIEETIM